MRPAVKLAQLMVVEGAPLWSDDPGRFAGHWSGTFELPLSRLPNDLMDAYSGHEFREGVAEMADLVRHSRAKDGNSLRIPWPIEIANHYYSNLINGSSCVGAWMEISPSAVTGALDHITTRILDFALAIERDFPDAGQAGNDKTPTEATMSQVFHTHIYGPVQNLANGGSDVHQNASLTIAAGDLEGLRQALITQGIGKQEIGQLETALSADSVNGKAKSVGPAVGQWLGKVAQGASASVIVKLVMDFLGIGG